MDKGRDGRDNGDDDEYFEPSDEEIGRAHMGNRDVFWISRLARSAPRLIKLADRADDIISDAKDREWWRGLKKRSNTILIWAASILAAIVAAITVADRWKGPHP